MITAFMGPFLALHLFTVNAIHDELQNSMKYTTIYGDRGAVYVHQDWRNNPQTPVGAT